MKTSIVKNPNVKSTFDRDKVSLSRFVDRRGRFKLAVEQIPQMEDRYELYLETKSWEKAAEAAARLKDPRYCCTDGNE